MNEIDFLPWWIIDYSTSYSQKRLDTFLSTVGKKAVNTIGKYKLAVTSFSSYSVKVLNAPHLLAVG